jgi:flagellar export protein FliJ
MAVSRALRRLLRIRDIEEEQSRLALEAARADLSRLKHSLESTVERDRRGRQLVERSVRSGELPDRLAGLEEARAAVRLAQALAPRILDAEQDVAGLREQYLEKRIERRQAETLIEEAEARDALDTERKSQQGLDDWYGNRVHAAEGQRRKARLADSGSCLESDMAGTDAAPECSTVNDQT